MHGLVKRGLKRQGVVNGQFHSNTSLPSAFNYLKVQTNLSTRQ